MSTKPRLVAPGDIYQISSKGVQNLNMFTKDELKIFFLEQLRKTLKKYSFTCYAFSISSNQYHLVLHSSQQSISDAMRHFNSAIAKMVNRANKRDGTVFATRFKSVIVENDKLKELIRYVHLLPVQQGECSIDSLDTYKWSSHSVLMGNNVSRFLNTEAILKLLGKNIKEYREFIRCKKIDDNFTNILNNVNCGKQGFQKPELWVIGKPEFIGQVIEQDKCRRLRIARHISEKVTFETIHEEVTRLLLLDNESLFRAGQFDVRSTARELFVCICKQRYDFNGVQIAKYLKATDSAVSRMITRFSLVENNDYLISRIADEIVKYNLVF